MTMTYRAPKWPNPSRCQPGVHVWRHVLASHHRRTSFPATFLRFFRIPFCASRDTVAVGSLRSPIAPTMCRPCLARLPYDPLGAHLQGHAHPALLPTSFSLYVLHTPHRSIFPYLKSIGIFSSVYRYSLRPCAVCLQHPSPTSSAYCVHDHPLAPS